VTPKARAKLEPLLNKPAFDSRGTYHFYSNFAKRRMYSIIKQKGDIHQTSYDNHPII
jgi:hypothetical protein